MNQLSDSELTVRHIPGPPLRKLIRCKTTKAFLTHDGGWTTDITRAAVFEDHAAAVAAKFQFHLGDAVDLYYSFDHHRQSQWDFTMNL